MTSIRLNPKCQSQKKNHFEFYLFSKGEKRNNFVYPLSQPSPDRSDRISALPCRLSLKLPPVTTRGTGEAWWGAVGKRPDVGLHPKPGIPLSGCSGRDRRLSATWLVLNYTNLKFKNHFQLNLNTSEQLYHGNSACQVLCSASLIKLVF